MGAPAQCIGAGAPSQLHGCEDYIITGTPSSPTESPTTQWNNAVTTFLSIFSLVGGAGSGAASSGAVESPVVVLGNVPEYIELGAKLGAQTFEIPTDVWNAMSFDERWAANQAFLDEAIANNAEFRLAYYPPNEDSVFYPKELEYLEGLGYTRSPDNTYLIPPGG
jgi:hypothetical protein